MDLTPVRPGCEPTLTARNMPSVSRARAVRLSVLLCCLLHYAGTLAAPVLSVEQLTDAITTITPALERIFVDDGTTGISRINFLPDIVVVRDRGRHLVIDNEVKQEDLLGGNFFGVDAQWPVLNVYIVNQVSFCAQARTSLAACADRPGRHLYFEGQELRKNRGDELFAHELAHSLGLIGHVPGNNLMHGNITHGRSALTPEQRHIISKSELIRDGVVTLQLILIAQ